MGTRCAVEHFLKAFNWDYMTRAVTINPIPDGIMAMTKPRYAAAYHFFNEEDTRFPIYEGIRETYDGPLSMATDKMMWNITRDKITERMVVSSDDAWDVEVSVVSHGRDSARSRWTRPGCASGLGGGIRRRQLLL